MSTVQSYDTANQQVTPKGVKDKIPNGVGIMRAWLATWTRGSLTFVNTETYPKDMLKIWLKDFNICQAKPRADAPATLNHARKLTTLRPHARF
jgi:hypothetical protein